MKTIIRTLLIGLGLLTAPLAHAQDTNIDWSAASDLQVELQAIEQVPPMPADDVTNGTTFWSAQHAPGSAEPWAPLPGNILGMSAWDLGDGTYLLDDLGYRYHAHKRHKISNQSSFSSDGTMIMAADDGPILPGDDDDDTNDYSPAGLVGLSPDYGTNLFIAQVSQASGMYSGIISNTISGVEYELQYMDDLESTNGWQSATPIWSIYGSDVTNWTTFSVPMISPTNMFFRVRSWESEDGSGLPTWWEDEYFGTNAVDPNAQDSAGDGWMIYQKYEMGLNPNTFTTPPMPQDVTSSYNPDTDLASISWQAAPGPVVSYTVEDQDGDTFTVDAADTSFSETNDLTPWSWPYEPNADQWLTVKANYVGGSSGWSSDIGAAGFDAPSPVISLAAGPEGSAYLAVSPAAVPAGTAFVRIMQIDTYANDYYSDDSFDTNYDIPLSAFTNGLYSIPVAWLTPSDVYGSSSFVWWGETLNANHGPNCDAVEFDRGSPFSGPNMVITNAWMTYPFYDGRVQMKQNLTFLLRDATVSTPVAYTPNGAYSSVTMPTNYVYDSYNYASINGIENILTPFYDNYAFANSVFNVNNLSGGWLSNNVYAFVPPAPGTGIPALLGDSVWLTPANLNDDSAQIYRPSSYPDIAVAFNPVTYSGGFYLGYYTMVNGVTNLYGLEFESVEASDGISNIVLSADGGKMPSNEDSWQYFYPATAQPQWQTEEYDFWQHSALPGSSGFSTTNSSDLLIAPVGGSTTINGYEKMALLNGYSDVFGYLGQYFANAYEIDTNGNVTTNQTGILSPYGDFFPTYPGLTALVTMPDPDTGAQGTCTVYCVSLALDANHDGNMDLNFGGTDATSPLKPYVFWCNNNYDRWTWDADDGTNYMDDVALGDAASMCPYTPNIPTPDCNYRDMYGNRVIPDTRDLEDYARLWVCGVTSNLLAALPAGSTVTLNWGDVGNPNSANPTIDIFQATDPDGGVEYLTNETSATTQIDPAYSSYVGRLGPGGSIQLNSSYWSGWAGSHLIWCGVSNGTGGLNLTIADTNGNVLAQTTAYIQIEDIKQMYERWTVGDEPSVAPLANAEAASEDLPPFTMPFQYTPPQDTNTPYILFVHGWNMDRYDKDRFAETAFKRLYWQGYHGRFGSFRWPTSWGFTGDFSQLVTDPQEKDNYDNSENFAWLSAVGLLNKLEDLNTEYSGQVYLLAHSMGNVVAGEAVTLAGNNQVVNTYVASQAAVAAHVYDYTIPNYSFDVVIGGIQFNLGPNTPNIYGDWFAGDNGGGAGRIISLYNTNDYALSRLHWQLDQLVKPDILVSENGALWNYGYNGSTNDPSPWNNFFKTNDFTGTRVNFDIVNTPTNRYEVMAYAAQAYTTALGATPDVGNLTKSLNLITLWPSPDPLDNDYASHFYHSAEFRGDTVWEWNYWNTLLFSSQTGFNIANP